MLRRVEALDCRTVKQNTAMLQQCTSRAQLDEEDFQKLNSSLGVSFLLVHLSRRGRT
jgi:hypothetical protein